MLDTVETTWVGEQEKLQAEQIRTYVETISVADGRLIELPGVMSPLDEPIFISARVGESMFFESDKHHLVLIDIFVRTNMGVYEPIGRYDLQIAGNTVVNNRNRHGHLDCVQDAHRAANSKWPTAEGFRMEEINFMDHAMSTPPGGWAMMQEYRDRGIVMDEEQWNQPVYQNMGVEQLMIATASCVLRSWGVVVVNPLTFNPNEQKAWASFGIDGKEQVIVDELLGKNIIVDTISRFVNGN